MGIRVPEELAILAIGSPDRSKDPWAHVSSIVQLDHHQLGYTAARLLDEFLVSVTAAGSADVAASVLESISHGSRLELKLKPDGWEHPLHWSGHARELDSVPVAGDRLGLLLPDAAWRTLEPT